MFKSLNKGISAPIAITIIVLCALLVGGIVAYQYYRMPEEEEETPEAKLPEDEVTEKEQACLNSGGTVSTSMCCKATDDFPNLCVIGPCTCRSHWVKFCDCGPDKCFNGNECVLTKAGESPYLPYPYNIKLISPNGNEEWREGETYKIQWIQNELEVWGDVATLCLTGFDEKENKIEAKEEQSVCYWLGTGKILISESTLTKNEYQWTIPRNISERFEEPPSFYKISVAVYDHLSSDGRTEWAGFINSDGSDDYFTIISE